LCPHLRFDELAFIIDSKKMRYASQAFSWAHKKRSPAPGAMATWPSETDSWRNIIPLTNSYDYWLLYENPCILHF